MTEPYYATLTNELETLLCIRPDPPESLSPAFPHPLEQLRRMVLSGRAADVTLCQVSLHLYVGDVDAVVKSATDAGATVLRPVRDEFFGDRTATLSDPFGHKWHVASRKEDVSPEEMQRRWDAANKE